MKNKSKIIDISGMCRKVNNTHLKEFDKREREKAFKKTLMTDKKNLELKKNYSAK